MFFSLYFSVPPQIDPLLSQSSWNWLIIDLRRSQVGSLFYADQMAMIERLDGVNGRVEDAQDLRKEV